MEAKRESFSSLESIDAIVDEEINSICSKYQELSVKADKVLDRLRRKKKDQQTE